MRGAQIGVETVKGRQARYGVHVLALEAPTDAAYGELRARLEEAGKLIGANDLLIAAHALALDHTLVTDNEREFHGPAGACRLDMT
jgi:predicted nucleic acid-binding protein